MVKSKGWNWKEVKGDKEKIWKEPSLESYYLLDRWKRQNKKDFLDLGCGLGRHSILFGKNNFNVYSLDISEDAINRTREWADKEKIKIDLKVSDMIKLPYKDNSFDCIYCKNVISHTDTIGVKKIIKELYRVMRDDGECYLTLCSKDSYSFKNDSFPLLDKNTRLKMCKGEEYEVAHFYVDYDLIKELFPKFNIISIRQVIEYFEEKDKSVKEKYFYHVLIRK